MCGMALGDWSNMCASSSRLLPPSLVFYLRGNPHSSRVNFVVVWLLLFLLPLVCHLFWESLCISGQFRLSGNNFNASYKASDFCWQIAVNAPSNIWDLVIYIVYTNFMDFFVSLTKAFGRGCGCLIFQRFNFRNSSGLGFFLRATFPDYVFKNGLLILLIIRTAIVIKLSIKKIFRHF